MRVRYMRARIPFWRGARDGAAGWELRIACTSAGRRVVVDESATFVPAGAGERGLRGQGKRTIRSILPKRHSCWRDWAPLALSRRYKSGDFSQRRPAGSRCAPLRFRFGASFQFPGFQDGRFSRGWPKPLASRRDWAAVFASRWRPTENARGDDVPRRAPLRVRLAENVT